MCFRDKDDSRHLLRNKEFVCRRFMWVPQRHFGGMRPIEICFRAEDNSGFLLPSGRKVAGKSVAACAMISVVRCRYAPCPCTTFMCLRMPSHFPVTYWVCLRTVPPSSLLRCLGLRMLPLPPYYTLFASICCPFLCAICLPIRLVLIPVSRIFSISTVHFCALVWLSFPLLYRSCTTLEKVFGQEMLTISLCRYAIGSEETLLHVAAFYNTNWIQVRQGSPRLWSENLNPQCGLACMLNLYWWYVMSLVYLCIMIGSVLCYMRSDGMWCWM